MQALSPGGTLIESVFAPAHNVDATGVVIYVGAAPTPPFAGVGLATGPLSVGGQDLQNVLAKILAQPLPIPRGPTLGGSDTTIERWTGGSIAELEGQWIPAGWYWWIVFGYTAGAGVSEHRNPIIRWRELPEPQGPA